jgi:hypothetical protein
LALTAAMSNNKTVMKVLAGDKPNLYINSAGENRLSEHWPVRVWVAAVGASSNPAT